MKGKKIITAFLLGTTMISCTSSPFVENNHRTTKGGLGGAATGALVGQLIGKDTKGTLIGAGVGALAGLGWAVYRDRQEAELRNRLKNTGVQVMKMGESLNLTLPAGSTFAINSANIVSNFYSPLNSIAYVFSKYNETRIEIYGYTDSTGNADYNVQLSQKRADNVRNYLIAQGISPDRIVAVGYGSSNPVASNATEEGRAENRRVEIKILPLE